MSPRERLRKSGLVHGDNRGRRGQAATFYALRRQVKYVEQDRRADGPLRMAAFRQCTGNQERTHASGCGKLEIDRSICRVSNHRMPQSSPAAFPTRDSSRNTRIARKHALEAVQALVIKSFLTFAKDLKLHLKSGACRLRRGARRLGRR